LLQLRLYAQEPDESPEKEPTCGKTAGEKQQSGSETRLLWKAILFLLLLSRKFFEQLSSGAISLNFTVEFVDVVTHRHQEDLRQNLLFTSKQKLPEAVILLDDSKSSL